MKAKDIFKRDKNLDHSVIILKLLLNFSSLQPFQGSFNCICMWSLISQVAKSIRYIDMILKIIADEEDALSQTLI